jgi:hypothetical protein
MTPEHITLIQRAGAEVFPLADTNAVRCYERRFVPDPPPRSLFHGARREPGRQRMAMLQAVVAGLRRLGELISSVRQLGVRHPGGLGKRRKPGIAAVTTTGMEGIA